MDVRSRAALRIALFLTMGLLAVFAGCGSDGDDAGQDESQVVQTTPSDAAPSDAAASGEQQQIRALFAQMSKAIAARDAVVACPLMAKSAQRTFVMLAGKGPKTCEHGFEVAFKDGTDEARAPKLVKVEVQGPRAVVYARTKTSKQLEQAPFVKEGDTWKVESWLTD